MAGAKVSIIIPVYNTSRYLPQCLKSVIRQDYRNLEIILVNDASTDNSLEICRRYAGKDSRIIIIDKQKNEGLELARRSGLDIVSGKYIMHLDSDDWLAHRRVISGMYQKAEETGADYVEVNFYRTLDKFGFIKKKTNIKNINGLIEQPELFDKYFISYFGTRNLSVSVCGKLYRKSFLDKIDIKPLNIKMGEDLGYNIRLFPYLNKIYILSEVGYCYRFGGMTSKYNSDLLPDLKKLHKLKIELIEHFKYDKGRMTENRDFKNILKAEIRQRIRFHQPKEDIILFLKEEFRDPVYNSLLETGKENKFWDDPFSNALLEKDFERMHDVCRKEELKMKRKRIFIEFAAKLLFKF